MSWLAMSMGTPAHAQDAPLPPITVGAGLQTSFLHTEPDTGESSDAFALNSARLYINGPVTNTIRFMFNTEYNGNGNDVEILDAVARLEFSEKFNVWFGPSCRPATAPTCMARPRQFNARVMVFFKDTRFDAVRTNFMQFGVGLQIQM